MALNKTKTINTLKTALLRKGVVVYLDTEEFYSDRQNRLIKMFILSQRVFDDSKQRYVKQRILKTADQLGVLKTLVEMYKTVCAEEQE